MFFYLIISAVVIFFGVTYFWWRQTKTKNATIIDVIWAVGIALHTAGLSLMSEGIFLRKLFFTGLVCIWAFRLSWHLYHDRVKSGVEDGRYSKFRKEWSPLAFYGLYVAQGVLIFTLPLTFLSALSNAQLFPSFLDGVAFFIWALSIGGESLADHQLKQFKSQPSNKGKTCRSGLWKYSRHPNYFFEWLIWCSYIPFAWGSGQFLYSLIGPLILFVFLTRVSGVPPTEHQAMLSRGDDYRDYQKTTSMFFPWFPKKS